MSEGVITVSGDVFTATKLENGDILVANQTVHPSTASITAAGTGVTSTGRPSNISVGVNDCYSSWNDYWSASEASYLASWSRADIKSIPTSTTTEIDIFTQDAREPGTSTRVSSE